MNAVQNQMSLTFSAISENESFARVAAAAFVSQMDPTMEELTEIKTVVSEAVTNSIIHAYHEADGEVFLICRISGDTMELIIQDHGVGIADLELVRQPLYTSRPDLERTGMGFTIMESFVDEFEVQSQPGQGTRLRMLKCMRDSNGAQSNEV